MFIILHVLLALSALALSVYSNFAPTSDKIRISYLLAGGTLSSVILLIVTSGASILRTCLTGIVFFGIVSILNETARHKLASARNRN